MNIPVTPSGDFTIPVVVNPSFQAARRMVRPRLDMEPDWDRDVSRAEAHAILINVQEARDFEVCADNWPWLQGIDVRLSRLVDEVVVMSTMRERDAGAPVGIRFVFGCPKRLMIQSCAPIHGVIRAALAACVQHELDESLYVKGERRWDPHREESRR